MRQQGYAVAASQASSHRAANSTDIQVQNHFLALLCQVTTVVCIWLGGVGPHNLHMQFPSQGIHQASA